MMDIDKAFGEFLEMEAALNVALQECEDDQAAGCTGLNPYLRAKALSEKLTNLAHALSAEIEKTLATL